MAEKTPTGKRAGRSPFTDGAEDMTQTTAATTSNDPSDAPIRIFMNWIIMIGGMAALMYLGNMALSAL